MGVSADDGGTANNVNVIEAFDLPVTSRGEVVFDAGTYEVGQPVTVTVHDRDLSGGGPIDVPVVASGGDSETLTLTEVGGGVFAGTILTAAGAATPDDGLLNVRSGNVITVTYHDADDGTGNSAIVTDTADVVAFTDVFTQDFESGLGPNESVYGAFAGDIVKSCG